MADFAAVVQAAPGFEYMKEDDAPLLLVPLGTGTAPDTTQPTVTLVYPAADLTPISPSDAIIFVVFDETSLAHVEVRALQNTDATPPVAIWETIYDGSSFVGKYTASTIAVLGAATFRFTVRRDGNWNTAPSISVTPIDDGGNKV